MNTVGAVQPRHLTRSRARTIPILLFGAAVSTGAAVTLSDSTSARWVVAGLATLTLLAVALDHRINGVLVATAFLVSLGFLRRLLTMVQADPQSDPLLLVIPVFVAVLLLLYLWEERPLPRSRLLLAVGALVVLSILCVADITYYPLHTNIEGLLIWTVPMLWFPVGRQLLDSTTARQVLRVVAVVGGASCVLGLYQVIVELPAWDERWFLHRGYAALGIEGFGTLHPWGFASSAAEFAQVASIVFVICILELWDGVRRRVWPLVLVSVIGAAISLAAVGLSAVRAAQLMLVVGLFVLILASRVIRPVPFVLGVVLMVALVVGGVRRVDVEGWQASGGMLLVRRSLLGLSDPFDRSSSTLQTHLDLTEYGLRQLDDRPFGAGTAGGTIAARRGGGEYQSSAENDLGNAALAFGIAGVVLVVGITALGLHAAWRRARTHRSVITLATVATLVLSVRWWWHGSHYGTAMLIWLLLGHTDRSPHLDDPATAL